MTNIININMFSSTDLTIKKLYSRVWILLLIVRYGFENLFDYLFDCDHSSHDEIIYTLIKYFLNQKLSRPQNWYSSFLFICYFWGIFFFFLHKEIFVFHTIYHFSISILYYYIIYNYVLVNSLQHFLFLTQFFPLTKGILV